MVDSLSRSVNFDLVEERGMGTNDISLAGIRHCLSSAPLGMNVGGGGFCAQETAPEEEDS